MRDETRCRRTARGRAWVVAGVVAVLCGAGPQKKGANPGDDLTFRPTVIVRKGNGQGSGTIIASVDGETLVLTAAHVVREPGPLRVELHRYNLGVEQAMRRGGWPVSVVAEVAAADTTADVAVVRARGHRALPFVARLGAAGDEPAAGAVVTSVGVDGGDRLESWSTRVRQVVWFALVPEAGTRTTKPTRAGRPDATTPQGARFRPTPRARTGEALGPGERPFLLTTRAPEHGRSGGGLFLHDGPLTLVGVCVGRVELGKGRAVGVFASGESVRRLLRDHDLDTLVARSEAGREAGSSRAESVGRAWLRGR